MGAVEEDWAGTDTTEDRVLGGVLVVWLKWRCACGLAHVLPGFMFVPVLRNCTHSSQVRRNPGQTFHWCPLELALGFLWSELHLLTETSAPVEEAVVPLKAAHL